MRSRTPFRRPWIARPIAGVLAAVFLALSVSAGFHRGEHDDLGWLPSRFHQHDFQWQPGTGETPTPLADHCLACHVTRSIVRFASAAAPLPDVQDTVPGWTADTGAELPSRTDFSRIPRAPPVG
jgi:hypothetical protein